MNPTKTSDNSIQPSRVHCSPASAGSVKPFAVLRLTDLRLFRFEHKDEMQDAIRAMRERDAGFVPLLWHAGANTWTMPDTWQ